MNATIQNQTLVGTFSSVNYDENNHVTIGGGVDIAFQGATNQFDAFNTSQTIDTDFPRDEYDAGYPRNDSYIGIEPFAYSNKLGPMNPKLTAWSDVQLYSAISSELRSRSVFHDNVTRYPGRDFTVRGQTTLLGRIGDIWLPIRTVNWGFQYKHGQYAALPTTVSNSMTLLHTIYSYFTIYKK